MGPTAFDGNLDLDELFNQRVLKYVSKYKAAKFFTHLLQTATSESVSLIVVIIIFLFSYMIYALQNPTK